MKKILAMCILGFSLSAHAQVTQPLNAKTQDKDQSRWIINLQRGPQDWAFAMGPTYSDSTQLTLMINSDQGKVAFECRKKDGYRGIAIQIKGLQGNSEESKEFNVSVGFDNRVLEMKNQETSSDLDGVWIAEGPAVSAILYRMAEIGENIALFLSFKDSKDHEIRVPLTNPRSIAANANLICEGWWKEFSNPQEKKKDESNGLSLPLQDLTTGRINQQK